MKFINKNKIVQAVIIEPNQSKDPYKSHGWRLYIDLSGGFTTIIIEKDSREECEQLANELGLTKIQ